MGLHLSPCRSKFDQGQCMITVSLALWWITVVGEDDQASVMWICKPFSSPCSSLSVIAALSVYASVEPADITGPPWRSVCRFCMHLVGS